MPFIPPALDDRNYQDLVDELIARIPAHTPEWTNPRDGDPGRTLIELFAWLADTLLYRANLIPERQRLSFLRLLGIPLRPAIPARGVINVQYDDDTTTSATSIRPLATLAKPVHFETLQELTVLPITAEAYYKRELSDDEEQDLREVITGLRSIYGLSKTRPYVTATVFPGGAMEPNGFDLVGQTVDHCLWLALLAPKKDLVGAVTKALGTTPTGGQQLLNIGIVPTIRLPDSFEDIGKREGIPHLWEITGVDALGRPDYFTLDVIEDNTNKLTKRGVIRLALPADKFIAAPSNDARRNFEAGVGDRPPRLDAADKAERLVAWVRLRPARLRRNEQLPILSLSWIGINAVEIDQRQTITGRVIGQSDGSSGQVISLRATSVDPASLEIHVEETNRGYVQWKAVSDLALAGRDDAVFQLDPEAGTITFGDGLRGRVPTTTARVRVAFMRAGGGLEGNLPPGSLTEITAQATLPNTVVPKLKVQQMTPTDGGEMAESIAQAELRVPAIFRHRDRAITVEDYRQLAADTPGVRLGRVEVLPKFRPQQRRPNVPGVVSVMVLPYQDNFRPPNPRPDSPTIEAVHAYLNLRRPVTTEMYVIGCEYIKLGVSVGVTILGEYEEDEELRANSTFSLLGRDAVLTNIRETLRRFLWPLMPGGVAGMGWPLGRNVRDRELEVVVARVPGVDTVLGVNLFIEDKANQDWKMLPRPTPSTPQELVLGAWQLPELLSVVVVADENPPQDLRGVKNPFAEDGVAIPVVPKVC